jgi:hypothetical protein
LLPWQFYHVQWILSELYSFLAFCSGCESSFIVAFSLSFVPLIWFCEPTELATCFLARLEGVGTPCAQLGDGVSTSEDVLSNDGVRMGAYLKARRHLYFDSLNLAADDGLQARAGCWPQMDGKKRMALQSANCCAIPTSRALNLFIRAELRLKIITVVRKLMTRVAISGHVCRACP